MEFLAQIPLQRPAYTVPAALHWWFWMGSFCPISHKKTLQYGHLNKDSHQALFRVYSSKLNQVHHFAPSLFTNPNQQFTVSKLRVRKLILYIIIYNIALVYIFVYISLFMNLIYPDLYLASQYLIIKVKKYFTNHLQILGYFHCSILNIVSKDHKAEKDERNTGL